MIPTGILGSCSNMQSNWLLRKLLIMQPPHILLTKSALQSALLLIPLLVTFILVGVERENKRLLTCAFVATLWNFVTLMIFNQLAIYFGIWSYATSTNLLLGLPLDVILGWAIFWGADVFLIFRGQHFVLAVLLMIAIDLLLMPHLQPLVRLGEYWLIGEFFV